MRPQRKHQVGDACLLGAWAVQGVAGVPAASQGRRHYEGEEGRTALGAEAEAASAEGGGAQGGMSARRGHSVIRVRLRLRLRVRVKGEGEGEGEGSIWGACCPRRDVAILVTWS